MRADDWAGGLGVSCNQGGRGRCPRTPSGAAERPAAKRGTVGGCSALNAAVLLLRMVLCSMGTNRGAGATQGYGGLRPRAPAKAERAYGTDGDALSAADLPRKLVTALIFDN